MSNIIIFDFDGTVYDTLEGITRCMQYALGKQGISAGLEELRCFAGPPLAEKLMEVYGFDREKAEQTVAYFRERYTLKGIYESRIFPGIKEFLEKLRAEGKRLGIATSKPEAMALKLMESSGILSYFEVVCGSRPDGSSGTKEQILREALDKFKTRDAILVGDTKYDIIGAHSCGIRCAAVRYGYAAKGELEEAGADIIAENLEELLDILLSK